MSQKVFEWDYVYIVKRFESTESDKREAKEERNGSENGHFAGEIIDETLELLEQPRNAGDRFSNFFNKFESLVQV